MGRRPLTRAAAAIAAVAIWVALPAAAAAHPLGNFTINHFAGITVAPKEIRLDIVIDMAEIPTFQERQHMDTDGDGTVSDAEAAAAQAPFCARQSADLRLSVGGAPATLEPTSAAISFPAGLGGLSTMRLECSFVARLAAPLGPRRRSRSRTSRTPSGSAGARSSRRATAFRSRPVGCRRRACRSG
jgi:hypothetical protein